MRSSTRSGQRTEKNQSSPNGTRGDWVPYISGGLILIALLLMDLSYYRISQAMTLLFYAVLVRIWTELGPSRASLPSRDGAFLEFIIMAVGAVIIGSSIRFCVEWVSGEMLAIQSLALSVLFSRWYVNITAVRDVSLATIFRYQDPIDRYLVLPPCLVAFTLPIVFHWFSIRVVRFDTTGGFFGLLCAGVLGGLLFYTHETTEGIDSIVETLFKRL